MFFKCAKHIRELQPDKFYVLFLCHLQNCVPLVYFAIFHHSHLQPLSGCAQMKINSLIAVSAEQRANDRLFSETRLLPTTAVTRLIIPASDFFVNSPDTAPFLFRTPQTAKLRYTLRLHHCRCF